MDSKSRIKGYASQVGVSTTGGFKNSSATKKLVGKLTPAQQKRLRKKEMASA